MRQIIGYYTRYISCNQERNLSIPSTPTYLFFLKEKNQISICSLTFSAKMNPRLKILFLGPGICSLEPAETSHPIYVQYVRHNSIIKHIYCTHSSTTTAKLLSGLCRNKISYIRAAFLFLLAR